MRHVALLTALVALAAPAVAHAQRPALEGKLRSCESGPEPADRVAVFTGSMPAVPGTRRMAMRFDLLQRTPPSDVFVGVSVPGLGVWQKSRPGRSGFIFSQRVQGLAAPGAYLAVVRFRWYDAHGKLLRSARRETKVCRQPDQRPDLSAGALDAVRGPQPGAATYSLVVRNDGRGPAGPFDVVLTANGAPLPPQRLTGLEPGASAVVTVIAPACEPGGAVRIALDARSEVTESREANNTLDRPCPFLAARARAHSPA